MFAISKDSPVTPLPQLPKVGDNIYIDTRLYMYRGEDDFIGGLAKVISIEEKEIRGKSVHVIKVEEDKIRSYLWEDIVGKQAEWKNLFGDRRACPKPDLRPEFNGGGEWECLK